MAIFIVNTHGRIMIWVIVFVSFTLLFKLFFRQNPRDTKVDGVVWGASGVSSRSLFIVIFSIKNKMP